MLIRFSFENFRSFKDRQELSLVATSLKELPESLIKTDAIPFDLLRVAALYGSNASGKTNVLKGLAFVRGAVKYSQRSWGPEDKIPRDAFRFENSESKPSSFEVEFLLREVRYRYGFSVDSERVISEWLHAYPGGKQQVWFSRDDSRPDKKFTFGRHLLGENRAIEALTRSNSLFLSAAAQNAHTMLLPVYNWFVNDLRIVLGERGAGLSPEAVEFCRSEAHAPALLRLLSASDLGVTKFRLDEQDMPAGMEKVQTAILEMFPKTDVKLFDNKFVHLILVHRGANQEEAEFPLAEESAGTAALFSLLVPAVTALESGGTLLIDELDSSLHPLLALELVRLFNDEKRNPFGAQLIFNTHDTNLLDRSVLRRDQVWFTEKDSTGASHLYPLTDFKPRRNENFKRGYLQGRYGAIPFLGDPKLSVESDEG